jgi:hypothetical protein
VQCKAPSLGGRNTAPTKTCRVIKMQYQARRGASPRTEPTAPVRRHLRIRGELHTRPADRSMGPGGSVVSQASHSTWPAVRAATQTHVAMARRAENTCLTLSGIYARRELVWRGHQRTGLRRAPPIVPIVT